MHADKRQMLLDLTQALQLHPTKGHILWELSNCIASAVGADSFRLYMVEDGNPDDLSLYIGEKAANGGSRFRDVHVEPDSVPSYVAHKRENIRTTKLDEDPRFAGSFRDSVSVWR